MMWSAQEASIAIPEWLTRSISHFADASKPLPPLTGHAALPPMYAVGSATLTRPQLTCIDSVHYKSS